MTVMYKRYWQLMTVKISKFADFDEIQWVGRVFIAESNATNFNKKIVRVNGFSVEKPLEFNCCRF